MLESAYFDFVSLFSTPITYRPYLGSSADYNKGIYKFRQIYSKLYYSQKCLNLNILQQTPLQSNEAIKSQFNFSKHINETRIKFSEIL